MNFILSSELFFFKAFKSITQYFQNARKGGGVNFLKVAGGRVSM